MRGLLWCALCAPGLKTSKKDRLNRPKFIFVIADYSIVCWGKARKKIYPCIQRSVLLGKVFTLEEIIRFHKADHEDCYFWATVGDAELDLLIVKGTKKMGFEFKYTDSPKATKSMQIAMDNLGLDSLKVIIPLEADFYIKENIRVMGPTSYLSV